MTIVVKKVPKCLRGFVKFIFGIKDYKMGMYNYLRFLILKYKKWLKI